MTLSDVASIGNIVAAIAVVASLIYLSRQVRHANLLARSHVRQRMVEQAHDELYVLMNHPDLREAWLPETKLSPEAQSKLAFFLAAAMRPARMGVVSTQGRPHRPRGLLRLLRSHRFPFGGRTDTELVGDGRSAWVPSRVCRGG